MPLDTYERRSGSWGGESETNPVLRFILRRSWLLLVPLIALAWYNTRTLTPQVKQIETQTAEAKQRYEEQRHKILTESRKLGVNISLLTALGDTFQVRFGTFDALIDSVYALRDADLAEVRMLEARGDSLRSIYSEASSRSTELSALLAPMQVRIDSLKAQVAARDENIRRLVAEKQADQDLAQRVLRPDLIRKNSALVTGEGEFPNRDALPKR